MKKQCEGKRGFFTLYDCIKEARRQCSDCGRFLCNEHMSKDHENCYECVAKSEFSTKEQQAQPYKLRHEMMKNSDYRAIHFGVELSDYYDAYDTSSFDVKLSKVEDMADSPDELFFDS